MHTFQGGERSMYGGLGYKSFKKEHKPKNT